MKPPGDRGRCELLEPPARPRRRNERWRPFGYRLNPRAPRHGSSADGVLNGVVLALTQHLGDLTGPARSSVMSGTPCCAQPRPSHDREHTAASGSAAEDEKTLIPPMVGRRAVRGRPVLSSERVVEMVRRATRLGNHRGGFAGLQSLWWVRPMVGAVRGQLFGGQLVGRELSGGVVHPDVEDSIGLAGPGPDGL